MKISTRQTDYTLLEQELCGLHAADNCETIDREFEQLKKRFATTYSNLHVGIDFEFTDWHHNIRMLWVYLYSDQLYDVKLLTNIQSIIASTSFKWFTQLECYSPTCEGERNTTGLIGNFLIYEDSVIFDGSEDWTTFRERIAE